jgi:hypothetical protein
MVAGGDPAEVVRMGDGAVNQSIGGRWLNVYVVEHLLLLASLADFKLTRRVDVPGTFGRTETVRPIGPVR